MAVHQPHLLDFSSPPPPSGFDNDGLLALHVVDMQSGGDAGVLSGDDTAQPIWPQDAVSSLFLFNNYSSTATAAGASPASHRHHRPAPPVVPVVPVEPNQLLLQVVPAEESLLQRPFQLRSSKYLAPVRELLSEFCSLEGDLFHAAVNTKRTAANNKAGDDVQAMPSSGGLWGSPSLMMSSVDLMELERRKVRLLSMVQEVDRRYRRYRDQMKSVEVWFEAVAGAGASQVYTRLARRAMSRHFRCLRDALAAQVRALKREEKCGAAGSSSAPPPAGATKGATPRLRVLEQSLRQQRAFQQHSSVGAMETTSCPWRPQRGLPERAVAVLRAWLFEHFLHPYPNDVDKHILARQTGLSRSQVSNWFINARVRLWKPMIEDMYKDEVNPQQPAAEAANNDAAAASTIVKAERMSTSSSILGGERSYCYQPHQQQLRRVRGIGDSSSIIATDGGDLRRLFHKQCTRSYPNLTNGSTHSAAAVSLTLGLQQQQQQPLHASSMTMMQQQPSGGLILEEQQSVVLPYRNLMGPQSLHDLAG